MEKPCINKVILSYLILSYLILSYLILSWTIFGNHRPRGCSEYKKLLEIREVAKRLPSTLWKTLPPPPPPPPPPATITSSSKLLQAYCIPQNFFFVDFSLKKSMIFQPEFPFGFFWFSFLLLVLIKERRPNEHFWLSQPFIYPPLTLFFKNVLLRVLRLPTFTPLLQHLCCQLIILILV